MQAMFIEDACMSEDESISGKAKGGIARAISLDPERRREIGKAGADARWKRRGELPIAKFGSPERPLHLADGVDIPCYVLNDGTRVLTQEGFLSAIGRAGKAKGGQGAAAAIDGKVDRMPSFLAAANLNALITENIRRSTTPIVFTTPGGSRAFGYRAELLPQVCNIYLDARDKKLLKPSQFHIADKAQILVRALAETGIIALVDEATGYQEVRAQDALQKYLEKVIRRELAAWVKRFPDEFYENIYKLRNWPWPGMGKNRFSVVAHYTRDLVYDRLGPGILRELETKSPKTEDGQRKSKLHQWLTDDVGHPMLAQHLHSLIMFQRLAIANGYGWNRFVKMVDQVLPRRGQTFELPLLPTDSDDASERPQPA
jgi:hypothetical protein